MLGAIVRFSLKYRSVVIALSCLLVGYGLYTLSHARYDVFPEFAPPQVSVQTEAPGLAPEQVEVLVTQPIESAINGVTGIESMRSNSIQGLSVVTINFLPHTDIFQDRQAVSERLASLAGTLPQGVLAPLMSPLTSSTGDLMTIGLTSNTRSLMDLRTLADWVIKPRLLAVPGVAKIGVFGGEVKQFQVQIKPERLLRYGLSVDEVLAAVRRATGVLGAGFIDTPKERVVLQTLGQSFKAEDLGKVVLTHPIGALGSVNIRLGDIATVREAPEPPFGAATVMGRPGVVLNVWAQYGANTVEATQRVEEVLRELDPVLKTEQVDMDSSLFRAATFIQTATRNVRSSLVIGAVLVIVVLFLFLLNWHAAAISCTAIPVSLLTAVTVLDYFGLSLNTMTLGGLAIAIGIVVDDAIIDVENILRRLRLNRALPHPLPKTDVIWHASLEVRSAVVYATLAVVLVFLPILSMSGLAGRLFAPLGFACILATMASLVVALTLTPALCAVVLKEHDLKEHEPRFVERLKEGYGHLLRVTERHRGKMITGAIFLTLLGVGVLPFLGGEFLPQLREGHFIVHVSATPGTSLEESLRLGSRITQELLKVPYVRRVAQRAGRAAADDVYGTHYSEFEVDLKPLSIKESAIAPDVIREAVSKIPNLQVEVKTFLSERVEETLSGYTASVVVRVVGNDLEALDKTANQILGIAKSIVGAADVQLQAVSGIPQLSIRLRPEALANWGFAPVDVLEAVKTAYQGAVTGQMYDGNRVFNVAVVLDFAVRNDPAMVGALCLKSPGGTYVPLKDLAVITKTAGRYEILHDAARRMQVVTCNVTGRDLNSFTNDLKARVSQTVPLPTGTYLEYSGASEAQTRSMRELLLHSLVAAIGIGTLLSIILGSGRNLMLVLANLPFAFVGGVLAVFLSRSDLSMGSLVGFVTLFGITVRNAIMMMSHFEHLVTEEHAAWNQDTAVRGATERLVPILMTALVTALGLLPLALGSGAPGREIEGPMAVVILGGLASSTVLNLLVLPTLALRFARFERHNKYNSEIA